MAFSQCCQPQHIDEAALRNKTVAAMRAASLAPEFIYAYERTGLIVASEYRMRFSAADLDEWDDAVAEYRELHPPS